MAANARQHKQLEDLGIVCCGGMKQANDAGEILMILGANGCGKSTLMRSLVGDRKNFTGSIEIKGKSLHEYTDLEMRETSPWCSRTITPRSRSAR